MSAPATPRYPLISLLGLGLLCGLAWWLRPEAPPYRPGPASPCPLWLEITGDVTRPMLLCLRETSSLEQQLGWSQPRCALPRRLPRPKSHQRIELRASKKGLRCRWKLLPLTAARRLLLGMPLSLNQSSAQELALLPGLSSRLARRLVAYRRRHGPFRQLEAMVKVKGIGPKTLARLRKHLVLD